MFDVGPWLLSFLVFPFTVIYQFAMLFTQIGLWLPVFSIVTGIGLGGCVVRHRVNPPALGWAERAKGKPATKNYDYATQHTFEIDDRNCWYNPVYKNWGATLSRVGHQLLVVDHKHSKEEPGASNKSNIKNVKVKIYVFESVEEARRCESHHRRSPGLKFTKLILSESVQRSRRSVLRQSESTRNERRRRSDRIKRKGSWRKPARRNRMVPPNRPIARIVANLDIAQTFVHNVGNRLSLRKLMKLKTAQRRNCTPPFKGSKMTA
jgi:hypothetical protein